MSDYKTYFKGKKVTLMGLGLLGRGVGDAIFLAENGTELIVTDLKSEKELEPSLDRLTHFTNITYHLGEHRLTDFRGRDFILKAAGVPLDSSYIAEAKKNGIPIEMDASLFFKLMPKGVVFIGVTGTRGKSTVTHLIYHILKTAKRRAFLAGNVKDTATLPLLEEVRPDDVIVAELDSWQLQGFGEAKVSPHVSVFTTFLDDHLNYYKGDREAYFADKANIFKYQKSAETLVVREGVLALVKDAPSKIIVARQSDVPDSWKVKLLGEHNRENVACAVKVAEEIGISSAIIKKAVESFNGVPGRLEYLRTIRGVKIYNDNNATTPDATLAALRALNPKSEIPACAAAASAGRRNPKQIQNPKALNAERNIVLIMGGTDKGLDMSKLVEEIPRHCKAIVMLKETGTDRIKERIMNYELGIMKKEKNTLQECVEEAMKLGKKGDIILFSPAFASFGRWFKNEYDRGNQFVELVKKL